MKIENVYQQIKRPALIALLMSALSPMAQADTGDGFKLAFNVFFGKESDRSDSRSCSNMDNGGGGSVLQGVNSFFCQMEKRFGITQAPTAGTPVSVTKAFGDRKIHVEISGQAGAAAQMAAGYNDDGTANPSVGYDYTAKVWVCKVTQAVTCGNAADFQRALSIAYSYKPDKTLNKGNLLQDQSARDGLGGGAGLSLIYNMGSTALIKKIVVKHIHQNGDKIRIDGTVVPSTNVMSVQLVHDQASLARRFSSSVDLVNNTAAAGFAVGIALTDNSTAADTAQCFNRVNDGGGDWNYSLIPGGSCSVSGYTDSVSTVNAYTPVSILKTNPGDTTWSNGMAPNPSVL